MLHLLTGRKVIPRGASGVRDRLRMLMSWIDRPQMILRVGWPPEGPPPASTPRRSVDVVLTVVDPPPGNG